MGKRSWKGKSSKSKRQRCGALVEPGQYGIYVTCDRGREIKASRELQPLIIEKLEEFYPNNEQTSEEEDDDDDSIPVEDAIKKELANLHKVKDKKAIANEVRLNADSLLFFHFRKPAVPSEFTEKFCEILYKSKIKNTRFIQRITPIDRSCNATMEEFIKMATDILPDKVPKGTSYMVNMTRRDFSIIERDDFMDEIAKILPDRQMHYKDTDKVIHMYCFKNNIGLSVTDYSTFQKLCKYNLQQIFDVVNGLNKKKPVKRTPKDNEAN